MPLSNDAVFPQGINTSTAATTTNAASLTGTAPSGTVLLFTAGANGSFVTSISAIPNATAISNGNILLLWSSDDAGTTKRLIDCVAAPADTYNVNGDPVNRIDFPNFSLSKPLYLKANERLYCGVGTNDPGAGWTWRAEGRDF